MELTEIFNFIINNGIGVGCVIYLISFQNTTLKKMIETMENIDKRLMTIEIKLDKNNKE